MISLRTIAESQNVAIRDFFTIEADTIVKTSRFRMEGIISVRVSILLGINLINPAVSHLEQTSCLFGKLHVVCNHDYG
jgi:hypothetical protein